MRTVHSASAIARVACAAALSLSARGAFGCNAVLGVEELPPGIWPTGSEGCQSCVEDSQCAAEAVACSHSPECREAYDCLRTAELPIDPAEMARCRIGDWGSLSRDLLLCAAQCSECGLREDMSCTDRWSYPSASTGEQVTMEVALVAAYENRPIVGARVTPCFPADPGCTPVAGPVVSDSEGLVTIDLSEGYPGFLEIDADGFGLIYFYPQQEKVFWETRTPLGMWSLDKVLLIPGASEVRPDLGSVTPSLGTCYNPLQSSLPVEYDIGGAMREDTLAAQVDDIQLFFNLEPGFWDVTATIPGHPPATRHIQVAPGVGTVVRLLPRRSP